MKILDFFRTPKKRTAAQVAKERLQIIVSHETAHDDENFINDLQRELLLVISKYVNIDPDQIKVQLEKHGGQSVLELNVTLPDLMKRGMLQKNKVAAKPEAAANHSNESKNQQNNESASAQTDAAKAEAKSSDVESKVEVSAES